MRIKAFLLMALTAFSLVIKNPEKAGYSFKGKFIQKIYNLVALPIALLA